VVGQEWRSEAFLRLMQEHQGSLKQPVSNSQFMKEVLEHGELRVNDEGWIYVKSTDSGFRRKFKLVNTPYAIPLLKGCRVDFFLRKYAENEGPKVKICGLHFRPLKLAGILKVINQRVYFEPRNGEYERMLPLRLPEPLLAILYECLPRCKDTLPYSIFKRYECDHQLINSKLANFVL
jgi:hypothetical protein